VSARVPDPSRERPAPHPGRAATACRIAAGYAVAPACAAIRAAMATPLM
jgi:hypothetical protein